MLGVFLRHESVYWLADATGYSRSAVFYMLGGAWESLLCGVLLVIGAAMKPSLWRDLMIAAMAIGVIEGLQITACRAFVGNNIAAVPRGVNLCDYLVGFPLGHVMFAAYLIAVCYVIGRSIRR